MFVIAYYIAILLVRIFVCTPISGFWDGKCVNLDAVFIADSFVSLITDGAILVLPILLTWSLHMSLKKKIKIASILGFGGLTTVTNVYRLYLAFAERDTADVSVYIVRLLYTGYVDVDPLTKYIWASVNEICSAAETAIGLTCSCLPAINALVDHKFRQRSSASSKGPSPGISPS